MHASDTRGAARMDGVSFSYGGERVLNGLSLEVPYGKVTLLVGENGSGKTTLMRLLLGELEPEEGTIEVLGRPVGQLAKEDWLKVGYVPQAASSTLRTFPATVGELVRASVVGARRNGRERARAALAEQGAGALSNHMLGELSGGQLQRVLLARACVNDPSLLLLDEPTSGLDQQSVDGVARFVRAQAEEGKAVLMITHDVARLGSAANSCRILRLERGTITHA